MENPLSGVELFVGGLTMLIGAGTADVLDRFLATHALQVKDAANNLYADQPPTTGSYANMFNGAAVDAPMDMKRWLAGGAVVLVPFAASGFVESDAGRSALQLFAFGALIRVAGKAARDGIAMLLKKNATGQRLYIDEMRAAALKKADGSEAQLVSAGLGRPQLGVGGCGCQNCRTGVGACCRTQAPAPQPSPQPPPTPPAPSGGPIGISPPGFIPGPQPTPQPLPPPPAPKPGVSGSPFRQAPAPVNSRFGYGGRD